MAPAATCSPGGVAFLAFAGEIGAVDAGVVQLGHGCGVPAGVGEDFGLIGGGFEGASDAHPEKAFLVVVEANFFAFGLQRWDAVAAAEIGAPPENETRMFL